MCYRVRLRDPGARCRLKFQMLKLCLAANQRTIVRLTTNPCLSLRSEYGGLSYNQYMLRYFKGRTVGQTEILKIPALLRGQGVGGRGGAISSIQASPRTALRAPLSED